MDRNTADADLLWLTEHLPLDELQAGDLPFDRTVRRGLIVFPGSGITDTEPVVGSARQPACSARVSGWSEVGRFDMAGIPVADREGRLIEMEDAFAHRAEHIWTNVAVLASGQDQIKVEAFAEMRVQAVCDCK